MPPRAGRRAAPSAGCDRQRRRVLDDTPHDWDDDPAAWVRAQRRGDDRRAGAWRRSFASRGVTLRQADCLIAAVSHGRRAVLATGNPRDFPMPELTVEHWPVGG